MGSNDRLEREVAALGGLSREELARRWEKSYGRPPPKGVKRGLLERAAAWQLQARMLGGLSPETRRALKAALRQYEQRLEQGRSPLPPVGATSAIESGIGPIVDAPGPQAGPESLAGSIEVRENRGGTAQPRNPAPAPRNVLSPGARLLREWNGRQHFVEVAENGYVFDGRTYRSLSAVARRITGAHWSGPRFFGL